MRVMQVAIDQVVDVITVRDGFVAASRAVNVSRIMCRAIVTRSAVCRVCRTHGNGVLFDDAIIPHPVQMPVVQIVGVIFMLDCGVTASRAMDVIVVVVCMVCHVDLHLELLYQTVQQRLFAPDS